MELKCVVSNKKYALCLSYVYRRKKCNIQISSIFINYIFSAGVTCEHIEFHRTVLEVLLIVFNISILIRLIGSSFS